tara:strand:- start:124 stop:2979 length:2856 start_codon:yes stop_codon:yes gene_type:complete
MGFGSEYPSGSASQGWYSASISPVNVTPGTINATLGKTFRMSKYNKFTNDPGEWHLSFADQGTAGTGSFKDTDYNCGNGNDILTGWHQMGPGPGGVPMISLVHQSNDLDGILSEAETTAFHENDVALGDHVLVWRHPKAWFEYKILAIDTNNVQASNGPRVHYGMTLINSSSDSGTYDYAVTRGGADVADATALISYYKPGQSTQALLSIPTAMSAASGAIHISITGSTQNGTPFEIFTTQSLAKSIGGTEPIVATQTNQSFTLIGNSSGIPANYIGSDNIINVFEGTSSLIASTNADTSTGQFFVSASGNDVAPGSISDSGNNIVIGIHGSATTQSGSISYQVTGRTLANTEFTRSLSQQFSITTAATDAKLVTLSSTGQVFIKDIAGNILPAYLGFTSSLQNTIQSNAIFTNNGGISFTNETTGDTLYNANRKKVLNSDMTVGVPLTITATSADDGLSDSMTIHLLDEGSGNVIPSLGNSNHTFQATADATVPSFVGGGTTLQVFEGATALEFRTSNTYQGQAGKFSASFTEDKITAGSFSGGASTTATLSIPTAMSETSASITIRVTGQTQNGTDFTQSVVQSFSKSVTGATGSVGPSFPFLSSAIDAIDTSGGLSAGLIMTPTVLGFHGAIAAGDGTNATAADFTSYLDNAGNFYLGKKSATPKAYLAWDNTDGSEALLISGSNANITVDKFFLGNHAQYISGSSGNIEISSSFFHLTADGQITGSNVKFSGGVIGGIEIGNDTIGAGDAWAISGSTYLADPIGFISSSAFKVSAGGAITASTMLLTGAGIRIPSGTFGVIESTNWGASAGAQLDLNGDELTFGGYTCPTFHVSSSGAVTHGGLVERTVEIDASNYNLYYSESITIPGAGENPATTHTTLILDGSLGGCVISNAILTYNTPSSNGFKNIKTLANAGTSRVNLFVNNNAIKFDDGQIEPTMATYLAKR